VIRASAFYSDDRVRIHLV